MRDVVRRRCTQVSVYALADVVEVPHAVVVALLVVPRLVDCITEGEGGLGDVLRIVVLQAHDGKCTLCGSAAQMLPTYMKVDTMASLSMPTTFGDEHQTLGLFTRRDVPSICHEPPS